VALAVGFARPVLASAVVMPPALAVTAGAVVAAPVALLAEVPAPVLVPEQAASASAVTTGATHPAGARRHASRTRRLGTPGAPANPGLIKAVTPRNRLVAQVSWHDG
jgi:hypothetical protein